MERAQTALMAAKIEARSAARGVGLVKLMGRSSGFIAMQASMASGDYSPCSRPVRFPCTGLANCSNVSSSPSTVNSVGRTLDENNLVC